MSLQLSLHHENMLVKHHRKTGVLWDCLVGHFKKIHSSKNLKGLFEVLLSFLNEKSQNVENRHERRLKLQEDIPRFSNS